MGSFPQLQILHAVDAGSALLALSLVVIILSRTIKSRGEHKLPPGPKPLPLIGNLFDLPKDHDWVHWAKHRDVYGPISSVTVFSQTIIILNGLEAALDLFERRSGVYSNRPTLTFSGEMCGWHTTLAFLQYGEQCKTFRRCIHQLMGTPKAVERYHDLVTRQAHVLLCCLFRQPWNLAAHVRFFPSAVTLRMLYGYEASASGRDDAGDPLVALAERTTEEFSDSSMAGRWLVDTLPLLKHVPSWIPGAKFKTVAKKYRKSYLEFVNRPYAFVKQEMKNGSALESFTADLLEMEEGSDAEKEWIAKHCAVSLYLAATDTTVSALHTFFLTMMLNPSVQKKAQAEIDKVIGSQRLPTIGDRPNLPYVNAVLKEVLRWNTIVPMGFPHVASQDDIYQGYLIPKGAFIMPNIWLFAHDEKNYADPFDFRPERFIKTADHEAERDPSELIFGFGRRECPGKLIADAELFLAIITSLAVFDIRRPVDENGKVIEEKINFSSTGLLNHPKEFKCSIVPRSERAADLIIMVEEEVLEESGHAARLPSLSRYSLEVD